jgi:aminodeoxychorismate synthase component I
MWGIPWFAAGVSFVRIMRVPELEGLSPVEVASRLQHCEGLVFFDSVGNFPSSVGAVFSIIAALPEQLLRGNLSDAEDLARLKRVWSERCGDAVDCGFPLGGLCGWVEYQGDFVFGVYPQMLVYHHETGQWSESGNLSAQLADEDNGENVPIAEVGEFFPEMSREEFLTAVERVREWIVAGDIYQVNVTQQFLAVCSEEGTLWSLYQRLRDRSPAPMASWMNLAGREVLSSSPETFLRVSGNQIETRPIKGTRPRFRDPDEDRRSAYELQTSAKEIAELVMITDLLRNDIGQVCEFGTVRVDEMLHLETLEQVFHLVSTVRGELCDDKDVVDALAACFPGGSITGAPKKRACEIIKEVEKVPRGLYCGAMGYLGFHGESAFNIVIRTLVREQGRLHYHVGAGIVADSEAAAEYEETLHKARGLREAVADWQNFCSKRIEQTTRIE